MTVGSVERAESDTQAESRHRDGVENTLAGTQPQADSSADGRGERNAPLNSLQVVSSVFAAGLGVQSSKNRERDFKQGRAGTFIAAGLVFTLLFIGSVYTVVTLVLSNR